MDEIYIYQAQMPPGIKEMVVPCSDGYTVYIDGDLSDEAQREAYDHALRHINNADHGKESVSDIETEAHNKEQTVSVEKKARKKPAPKVVVRRPLTDEECRRIGIPPEVAKVLKLTKLDRPPMSKKRFEKMREAMKDAEER